MNNSHNYKILLVEDSADDEMLIRRHFSKCPGNFHIERVETSREFINALRSAEWDIIISDYTLPAFSAQAVLSFLMHSDIDLPVIVVSGKAGEETAVEVMRWGAKDFICKNNMQRLHPSIVREISEYNLRKKSKEISQRLQFTEEKYQKFFDLNPAMIAVMSYPEERFLEVNLSFIKTLGYTIEELHQRTAVELGILTEDEHKLILANQEAFVKDFHTKMICKSGRTITCTVKATLTGENNNYLLLVMTDITDQLKKEAEQKLLESKFYQDQKLQAIGTLASGIAHDFNNILSIIIGNADFILMGSCENTSCKSRCETILQAGSRAGDLVKQILTFAREGSGNLMPIKLDHITKDCIKMLKDIIPSSIEIKSQISKVPLVLGDSNKMMQVITNLCVNASHAVSESKHDGLIMVTLNTFLPDSDFLETNPDFERIMYIKLIIDDNGCGIPEENLAKIFDPFFTTKEKGRGTGLGLSTVYGIIKEFNGKIIVDSKLGVGSAFNIYLPVMINQTESQEVVKSEVRTKYPDFKGSVLFVDDEELLVQINTSIMEKVGLEVHGFTNPLTALDYFADNYANIDLIITDLTMPGLNGYELLTKARQYKEIPAIICSGQESKIIELNLETKMNYFLLKPILINDLISTLKEILNNN